MTSINDPDLDALTLLSNRLSGALGAIGSDQLTLATPCADWDLAALVDHVTGGNWFTVQIFDGHTAEVAMTNTIEQFGGGSASLQEAVSSVTAQRTAFDQPGVLDRTWHHVADDLRGREILRLRLHDLIVHTWDIEQTLDPPGSLPAELVFWGLAELSNADSLTPKHFGLETVPEADATEDGATYLSCFGRQFEPRVS